MKRILFLLYRKIWDGLPSLLKEKFALLKPLHRLLYAHIKPTYLQIEGFDVYFDPADEVLIDIYSHHDPTEVLQQNVYREIRRGDIVVDLGANIGFYSMLASRQVGDEGRVYSFEPGRDNFKILQKNIAENECRNITAVQKAVADKGGTVRLWESPYNKGDHRIFNVESGRNSYEVEKVSLDEYFQYYDGKIDFLKMDIQGAEVLALKGMAGLLKKQKKIKILTEFSPICLKEAGTHPAEFLQLLQKYGFSLFHLDESVNAIMPTDIQTLLRRYNDDSYTNLLCVKGS